MKDAEEAAREYAGRNYDEYCFPGSKHRNGEWLKQHDAYLDGWAAAKSREGKIDISENEFDPKKAWVRLDIYDAAIAREAELLSLLDVAQLFAGYAIIAKAPGVDEWLSKCETLKAARGQGEKT